VIHNRIYDTVLYPIHHCMFKTNMYQHNQDSEPATCPRAPSCQWHRSTLEPDSVVWPPSAEDLAAAIGASILAAISFTAVNQTLTALCGRPGLLISAVMVAVTAASGIVGTSSSRCPRPYLRAAGHPASRAPTQRLL
jgi:hypothetical protein